MDDTSDTDGASLTPDDPVAAKFRYLESSLSLHRDVLRDEDWSIIRRLLANLHRHVQVQVSYSWLLTLCVQQRMLRTPGLFKGTSPTKLAEILLVAADDIDTDFDPEAQLNNPDRILFTLLLKEPGETGELLPEVLRLGRALFPKTSAHELLDVVFLRTASEVKVVEDTPALSSVPSVAEANRQRSPIPECLNDATRVSIQNYGEVFGPMNALVSQMQETLARSGTNADAIQTLKDIAWRLQENVMRLYWHAEDLETLDPNEGYSGFTQAA